MKTHHPKLKTTPCPLFSCGFFSHCTQTVLSPTTTNPSPLPLPFSDPQPPPPSDPPPQPPPPPPPPPQTESDSSSSSNTSQSFTQWRFPLPHSPISTYLHPRPESDPVIFSPIRKSDPPSPPPVIITNLEELFHVAELQLSTGSDSDRIMALHMLERSLVPNPPAVVGGDKAVCPAAVMRGVVGNLKERAGAKPATKVLLALCLAEGYRHVAVEAGAVGGIVEALADLESAAAERALAALELLCTVAEGAAEVKVHALAVPMLVEVMGKLAGRGREYAIGVLAVIYSGYGSGMEVAPPEEVARAVVLGMQGDCTDRGKRKGAQFLKTLQENDRLDLTQDGG